MTSIIPFSIPVSIYQGAAGPTAAEAPWIDSLASNALAGSSVCVLYNDYGSEYAGLYVLDGTRWVFSAPYTAVNDYIISGGQVAVYIDLVASVTPETGATIYRNGVLSTATSLTAGNVVWATIYVVPPSGYTLPPASQSTLGGVKQGSGISIAADGTISTTGGAAPANPTGTVGLTAVNGTAATFMRSDATPALNVAIMPTWTGLHTFSGGVTATGAINLAGGTVTVPTIASAADSTTSAASTAFTQAAITARAVAPSTTAPLMDGTAAIGTGTTYARDDHVHPTDTSLAPKADPTFTGTVTAAAINASGNVNVQGNLSSASNTQQAGPTNSGVALGGNPNFAVASLYDQTRAADNRTADMIFLAGAQILRFRNDAGNTAISWLSATGGFASGITGITSSSGSGAWSHTGPLSVQSVASGGNNLVMTGTNSVGVPTLSTAGAAVNISMNIATKGSGGINLQTNTAVTGALSASGQISITTAGSGLSVTGGTNAKIGTVTLVAGAATVANTSVTANSLILLTVQNGTAATGSVSVGVITAGTSFTIVSSNTADTTTVAYFIVEQS